METMDKPARQRPADLQLDSLRRMPAP